MIGQTIGYQHFVDGTRRPIYMDARGQYVLDDDCERVYGVWLIPEEECCDLPVIVEECRGRDFTAGAAAKDMPDST